VNPKHLLTTESLFPSPNGERSTLVFERRVRDQISEIPDTRRVTQSRYTSRFALLILLLLILTRSARASEPKFPPLTGRVVDDAGVLSASTQNQLTDMLAAHERATGEQMVVVTLDSLQGYTVEDYGYQLGRYWGIGQKGKNTGAILIVAPKEHKVRIEVGYGLEGQLTDAISATIIQNYILPSFKRGDFDAGVSAGTRSILQVLGGNPLEIAEPATSTVSIGDKDKSPIFVLWYFLFWALFFLWAGLTGRIHRGVRHGWDSGGGYGGGSFSGGGSSDGGGGFSGGGGSFGGGGASGSW